MFWKFVLRDSAIIAAAVATWWQAASYSAGSGPVADAVGVVAGLLGGTIVFLLHEWGHLLAGLAAGGTFPVAGNLGSRFLFEIDASNTIRQFTIMSLGGFAVTAVGLWVVYTQLPDAYLATRVTRGVAVSLATLTVVLEVPLLLFTLATGRIPEVASVTTGEDAASPAPAALPAEAGPEATTASQADTTDEPDEGSTRTSGGASFENANPVA